MARQLNTAWEIAKNFLWGDSGPEIQRYPTETKHPRYISKAPYPLGVRTSYGGDMVTLFGWPSRGGLIWLERVTGIDFDFLGLDPLDPPMKRDVNQDAEDAFCQKILLLGARWYDSAERREFLLAVKDMNTYATLDLDEYLVPFPTLREKRWVCVGWPKESQGGFWIVDYETQLYDIEDEDHLIPAETSLLMLARNMNERCEILKGMGGKFFSSLDNYDGQTFLRAWEWKTQGEVGDLVKIPYGSTDS